MFGPLKPYLRPYKWRIVWASFCSICNQVFDISQDVLMGLMVDVALQSQNSFVARLGFDTISAQLLFFVGVTVLNGSFEALFEYLYTDAWGKIAQDVQHDIRVQLYRHLQKLPLSYFESNSIGSLTTVVNDDVSRLEQFLDGGNYQSVSAILQMISSTVTVGIVLFAVSPLIMCIAFVPVLIVVVLSFYFKYRLGKLYKRVRREAGRIGGIVAHNIRGIGTIKSFVTQLYEQRRVENASGGYRDAGKQAVHTSALFVSAVRLSVASGYVASVATGAFLLMNGVFTTGAFTTMIFEAQRLIWPFIGLRDIIDSYERVMAAASRIAGVLKTPIETLYRSIIVPSEEVPDPLDIGDISFSHVSFSYKSGRPVLRDISLTIPENKTVAFVGTTGCGKSTIVKLLLRLYNPQEGKVFVGGRLLHEVDAYALRRSIGLVSQELFMIAGTIRENICYGLQKVSDELVVEAAKAAEIHDFITQLPDGYDTMMEERGQIFSGGQCQRIAIARALVRQPQLLIMDEATSAVDNETEEAINKSIAKMRHERTIVLIAHRLSAVRNADVIYVLDKGMVLEQGDHVELIARGGLYHRLWKIQTGGVV
ncbi:MAG: ATP-binding cassette, subfamily bacterial [Candidatus Dependentiae bacterium]|nr:ATP-binding cassette, subfamily bacterial [Candidatus Dependentiae bacterium]